MRKLAFDLGEKSCGFAISDELGIIASGLDNFLYENNDLNHVITKTKEIVEYYQQKIDTFVIGYPTNVYDSSKNKTTLLVDEFIQLLKQHFDQQKYKVVLIDERFTTRIATQRLKDMNVKAAKRKKVKDKMSAVVILESYLNKY